METLLTFCRAFGSKKQKKTDSTFSSLPTPPSGDASRPAHDCTGTISLLPAAADCDKYAKAFIERHGALIWSMATQSTNGHREEAEKAVHEIFSDVWQSSHRPTPENESLFIAMIARRRLIARYRMHEARMALFGTHDAHSSEGPWPHLPGNDASRLVHHYLHCLRPEERTVLDLALVCGQTVPAVAKKTNLSQDKVKSTLRLCISSFQKLGERLPGMKHS